MANGFYHAPVLLEECIEGLAVKQGGVYVDGTLGGGGHFKRIIDALDRKGIAIGIDKDPQSISFVSKSVTNSSVDVILEQSAFSQLDSVLDRHGVRGVDGILLDLGVSSHQIDTPSRGFSYQAKNFLDMRMDPSSGMPARQLLGELDEHELSRILSEYGEIHNAGRMAHALKQYVHRHGISTSEDITACIEQEYGSAKVKVMSKLFQALRIAVNNELDELRECLSKAVERLHEQGRLAVIAYHSLEDRIVKNFMRDQERACICPSEAPVCTCQMSPKLKRINRKAIRPSEAEVSMNRRARSARLRIAEKVVEKGTIN